MEPMIEEGLYCTKDELVADAVRRLLEAELATLVQPHKYYWNKLTAERDIEVTEDELDQLIHEIRAGMMDEISHNQ
jgi:Arc/MetJ-type ribon-helix-helix transcriptional regulator